jgi:L-asparaginase/Glu-tRNA(Gln) amidotransferase subunit D
MFQVKSIKIDIFEMGKISRSEQIVKKQVLVLYVGGTIGMKKNDDGGEYFFIISFELISKFY